MGAPKKATHEIVHPSLYMRVNDKLQQMKVGDQVTLTKDQAKRLGKKVAEIGKEKAVVVGSNEEKQEDKSEEKSEDKSK